MGKSAVGTGIMLCVFVATSPVLSGAASQEIEVEPPKNALVLLEVLANDPSMLGIPNQGLLNQAPT